MSDDKIAVFEDLAVRYGGFASPERAIFRCREAFKGVGVEGKTLLEIGAGAGVFSAYPLRKFGWLAANAAAAFFLSSLFRLVMQYEGLGDG